MEDISVLRNRHGDSILSLTLGSSRSMPTYCVAKASYKKASGSLELTDTHLQWTQDGKKAPSVRVAYSEATCQYFFTSAVSSLTYPPYKALFCSKEGAAQVRLKLGLLGDENGHNFTFTSPQPVAYTEREKFKKELTNIISRNRSLQDLQKPSISATSSAAVTAPASNAPTPRPLAGPSRPSTSRAASVSSGRGSTPVIAGSDPVSDFRLRKKVLISNPELGTLHRDLVMSGQITEAEFWDGREVYDAFCAYCIAASDPSANSISS
jgi:transcription initiation factor TFIIH subunit 1